MYVCMYVCMHACMHVCICMYVCMYLCICIVHILVGPMPAIITNIHAFKYTNTCKYSTDIVYYICTFIQRHSPCTVNFHAVMGATIMGLGWGLSRVTFWGGDGDKTVSLSHPLASKLMSRMWLHFGSEARSLWVNDLVDNSL